MNHKYDRVLSYATSAMSHVFTAKPMQTKTMRVSRKRIPRAWASGSDGLTGSRR